MSTVTQPTRSKIMPTSSLHSKAISNPLRDVVPELELILDEVKQTTAPVWPLADYVAVHPFFGLDRLLLRPCS